MESSDVGVPCCCGAILESSKLALGSEHLMLQSLGRGGACDYRTVFRCFPVGLIPHSPLSLGVRHLGEGFGTSNLKLQAGVQDESKVKDNSHIICFSIERVFLLSFTNKEPQILPDLLGSP